MQLNVDALTFGELWAFWPRLEQGIQRTLFAREAIVFDQNRYNIRQWQQWRWTALSVAGAGALVIAIGLFIVPGRHTRPNALARKSDASLSLARRASVGD